MSSNLVSWASLGDAALMREIQIFIVAHGPLEPGRLVEADVLRDLAVNGVGPNPVVPAVPKIVKLSPEITAAKVGAA